MDPNEARTLAEHLARDPDRIRTLLEQALEGPHTGDRHQLPLADPDSEPPLPADPTGRSSAAESRAPAPQSIQVWQPDWVDGALVFRRPPPGPLGDHFAARATIPAAKPPGIRRVCFFGESAAAGYLYAPWLTPAGELERHLHAGEAGGWEVIDLARTNETLTGMARAAGAALQLDPDVYVFFAGNNWSLLETQTLSPLAQDAVGRHAFGELLAAEGPFGPIRAADRARLAAAGAFFEEIAAITAGGGIRVVLVVPEVNLLDWEERQPAAWLPEDGAAAWYRALEAGDAALAGGDWDGAFEAGERMLALDRGANPTAFGLLARARRSQGEMEKARIAARAAADAVSYPWMHTLASPRASLMDQELLRAAAAHHGFGLVDLPVVFEAWTSGEGAGRRMFLDYCHLTREGIRAAAAAMAKALGALFEPAGGQAPGAADPPPGVRPPWFAAGGAPHRAAVVDAAAMFGAALHTAHRMPDTPLRRELLAHWIRAALAADPAIAERMLALAAARAARLPIALSPAHRENLAAEHPVLYAHGWDYPHLDAALIEVLLEVLGDVDPAARVRMIDTLVKNAPGGPLDLADPYHLAEPLERRHDALLPAGDPAPAACIRAFLPRTGFAFVDPGGGARTLQLVLRLPLEEGGAEDPGQVRIFTNGRLVGTIDTGSTWTAREFEIPAGVLQRGLNRLRIEWPFPNANGRTMMRAAVEKLRRGGRGLCRPVFGEIYTLRLT